MKIEEREELHRTIWSIANDLRGAVDGWDFKQYVLGMLFYRYISENLTAYVNAGEHCAGNKDFDYARLTDSEAETARQDLVNVKGFFILPSQLFANIRANAANDENLNETLSGVFRAIESSARGSESEGDFAGLFDDLDVNSKKLGGTVEQRNDRLVKLMNGVGEMKLGDYKENTIDAFGDAYEFLMGMYASNAGKSGGEFFTPQEVSELLTRLAVGDKKERMITDEVAAFNDDAVARSSTWFENLSDSFDRVNALFPELNLSFSMRYGGQTVEYTNSSNVDRNL